MKQKMFNMELIKNDKVVASETVPAVDMDYTKSLTGIVIESFNAEVCKALGDIANGTCATVEIKYEVTE